ncbi:MAG TPA: Hpt domain-containing protein, partial [Aggregicoccus sp.]|nr:Hpt domain-containing protein [Aggregicoccus sp.]
MSSGTTGNKALAEFVAEATETLEGLGRDLLALDEQRGQEPDPGVLNAVFRGAHSLKGLAAMFAQERITRLAHHAEDVLDRLRLGRLALGDEVLDALIESVDVFQALLAETSRGEQSPELSRRAEAIAQRLGGVGAVVEQPGADPLDRLPLEPQVRAVFTEYEEHRLRENVRRGTALWRVRAAFELSDFDTGLADLNARLKPLGEVISTLPSAEPGGGSGIAFDLIVGVKAPEPELRAALQGTPAQLSALPLREPAPAAPPVSLHRVPPPAEPAAGAPEPSLAPRPEAEGSLRSLTQTVRVDI